jgi:hypothetical protein
MCGGCPKCGVYERPEVEFDLATIDEMYCDDVAYILIQAKTPSGHAMIDNRADQYRTEDLIDLAKSYRDGSYKRQKEREEEDRMMDPNYRDEPDFYDED